MNLKIAILTLFFPLFSLASLNLEGGVALKGYDPVEYFKSNQAVKGDSKFQHSYAGGLFQFKSAENLATFKKSPSRYVPQYGGYCAYAVAKGYKYDVDPEAFAVRGGKLYLNANKSVQSTWSRDPEGFISQADKNWPNVKNQ